MSIATETSSPPRNYEILPKESPAGEFSGELLEVAMGPHHPSTHGVFRMDVALDGERVVKLKPVFGYLHRNHEKIAENTTYLGLRAFGGKAGRVASARTRRIHSDYHGGVDAVAEPCLPGGVSVARHGRAGDAADVCVPRAREDPRFVRGADGGADDVQLHAVRRLPSGFASRLARRSQTGGGQLSAIY